MVAEESSEKIEIMAATTYFFLPPFISGNLLISQQD